MKSLGIDLRRRSGEGDEAGLMKGPLYNSSTNAPLNEIIVPITLALVLVFLKSNLLLLYEHT